MQTGITHLVLRKQGELADVLPLVKAAGYDGMEVLLTADGDITPQSSAADLKAVRKLFDDAGMGLFGMCISLPDRGSLVSGNPDDAERFRQSCRDAVRCCEALGIDACLIIPGGVTPTQGIFMALMTGVVSAWLPARTAATTAPAVAMRGDRSDEGQATRWPWITVATARLPILMRISMRALIRRPSRTMFAVGGLICGTALLLSTLGLYHAVVSTIDEYLRGTRKYELDVGFIAEEGQEDNVEVSQQRSA